MITVRRSELRKLIERHIAALLREIKIYGRILGDLGIRVVDIHAGGGTPSLVPVRYWRVILEKLDEYFKVPKGIAIEANPEDLADEARVYDLAEAA